MSDELLQDYKEGLQLHTPATLPARPKLQGSVAQQTVPGQPTHGGYSYSGGDSTDYANADTRNPCNAS